LFILLLLLVDLKGLGALLLQVHHAILSTVFERVWILPWWHNVSIFAVFLLDDIVLFGGFLASILLSEIWVE
jgi:hypothetical protein